VKHNSVTDEFGYDVYSPAIKVTASKSFLARTNGDPLLLATAIKQAIWEVAPDTGVFNVTPVSKFISQYYLAKTVWGLLFSLFSLVALVMSAAGI